MSLIFWTQWLLFILFALFAYLILKRRSYMLISGFATRPAEEQQQLIENGYPQGIGRLFFIIAAGLLVMMPISLTNFRYTFELQIIFMMLMLFGGMIILSRREVPHRRKRAFLTSLIFTILVIGGVGTLLFIGSRQPDVTFGESVMEISGMYGDDVPYADIRSVELLDTMPPIRFKENGFDFADYAKGQFSVKGHGSSLLFVDTKQSPILVIQTDGRPIFITGNQPGQTEKWQAELYERMQ